MFKQNEFDISDKVSTGGGIGVLHLADNYNPVLMKFYRIASVTSTCTRASGETRVSGLIAVAYLAHDF